MLVINFTNVEELIFEKSDEIKKILPPYYSSFFEQWKMGKQFPILKQVGKSAMYDFLNHISDEDTQKLKSFFKNDVYVEKLNYRTVQNLKIPLTSCVSDVMCQISGLNHLSTWRDQEYLYITLWR